MSTLRGILTAGWPGSIAPIETRAARIAWDAAGLGGLGGMARLEPVGCPLPRVADHVEHAVAVGREGIDRRGPFVPVGLQVLPGELPLPGIGPVTAVGRQLFAPGEGGAVEPAARGQFPLGFGRQRLAGPGSVGLGVCIRDVDDRMTVATVDGAPGTVRLAPVGVGRPVPPVGDVAPVDRARGFHEDEGTREQLVRQRARIVRGVGRNLGERAMRRGLHELTEACIGHRFAIDPEPVDRDTVHRTLFGVVHVRSHAIGRARDPDHVRERRWSWRRVRLGRGFGAHGRQLPGSGLGQENGGATARGPPGAGDHHRPTRQSDTSRCRAGRPLWTPVDPSPRSTPPSSSSTT